MRTALLLLLLLGGCATEVARFTVASTKHVNLKVLDLTRAERAPGEGSSSRVWLLFIPLGPRPEVDEAMDRCLEDGRGDFIVDARVYDTSWSCLLFSWGSYVVRGEVVDSCRAQLRAPVHGP